MKKLYIIRHAKSSWKNLDLDDFDRPLNKRGKLNAPLMGQRLLDKKVKPDIVLSSPAERTKITAKVISKKLDYPKKIVFLEELYEAYNPDLIDIVKKIEDTNSVAFLFGHNSSLNDLAKYFVNLDENIPTCGVVEVEFTSESWKKITPKNAKLLSFDYPKKTLK